MALSEIDRSGSTTLATDRLNRRQPGWPTFTCHTSTSATFPETTVRLTLPTNPASCKRSSARIAAVGLTPAALATPRADLSPNGRRASAANTKVSSRLSPGSRGARPRRRSNNAKSPFVKRRWPPLVRAGCTSPAATARCIRERVVANATATSPVVNAVSISIHSTRSYRTHPPQRTRRCSDGRPVDAETIKTAPTRDSPARPAHQPTHQGRGQGARGIASRHHRHPR